MNKQFKIEQNFDFTHKKNKPKNIFERNKKRVALKNIWYISLFISGFTVGIAAIPLLSNEDKVVTINPHFKEPMKIYSNNTHNDFKNIPDLSSYYDPKINTIDLIMSNPTENEINYLKNHLDSFKIIK